jgi:3-oxoacyl-[acyl-carrier-protein] synthase II
MSANDVVVTGIGLVSSLGEGADRHWQVLSAPGAKPVIEAERFAPYTVHPLPAIDWSLQIPKRGDQRQMEAWQRLGTYTAGLALDDAGVKGDEALLGTMDMIVAAGGGERDSGVDQAILDAGRTRNDRDLLLNEKLTTELRPTLFLAQLSNLLAGGDGGGAHPRRPVEPCAGRRRVPDRASRHAARLRAWRAPASQAVEVGVEARGQ